MMRLRVAVSTPMGQLKVQRRQLVQVPKAMSFRRLEIVVGQLRNLVGALTHHGIRLCRSSRGWP